MAIPFIQYLRPNGRERAMSLDASPEIERQARLIIEEGYTFTAEILTTGWISMTCEKSAYNQIKEVDLLAIELCTNGPSTTEAVTALVARSYDVLSQRGLI